MLGRTKYKTTLASSSSPPRNFPAKCDGYCSYAVALAADAAGTVLPKPSEAEDVSSYEGTSEGEI